VATSGQRVIGNLDGVEAAGATDVRNDGYAIRLVSKFPLPKGCDA
jgi:hypothetical protein